MYGNDYAFLDYCCRVCYNYSKQKTIKLHNWAINCRRASCSIDFVRLIAAEKRVPRMLNECSKYALINSHVYDMGNEVAGWIDR